MILPRAGLTKNPNHLSFMENENEQAQPTEQEEQANGEAITIEDTDSEDVVTVSKKDFTKMQRQALAYQANKAKPALTRPKEADPELKKDVDDLKQERVKREFGYRHNLSPEETDQVFRINPSPNQDTLKDPFVMGGLERIRAQKRIDDNTPSSSGKAFSVGGKTWEEMDQTERNANYPEYLQSLSKARRS
jgi:hypothetical protein